MVAMLPVLGHAAGTYYTGAYQSPQQRYTANNYATRGYANTNGYAAQNRGYATTAANRGQSTRSNTYNVPRNNNMPAAAQNNARQSSGQSGNGFWVDAGLAHQFAQWEFKMKSAGSKLNYNDINWNVFDINAGYKFAAGKTKMQVDAGFQYGMQFGESTMTDDDITNGGLRNYDYYVDNVNTGAEEYLGSTYIKSLSIGASKDGSMMGFNAGFGLTDFLKWGNVRITPSVGFRYMKTELETKQNNGLAVQTAACFTVPGSNAVECDPAIFVYYKNGSVQLIWREMDANGNIINPGISNDVELIDPEDTFAYYQPGTSHSYETTWMGPYVAMDFDYAINANNAVQARLELGLPMYKSTGDQPYRPDWMHPKSVEDEAGLGNAYHLGLGANWTTALTDKVALTVGLTYDYYTVADADATTYLNPDFYRAAYNLILKEKWGGNEDAMLGKVEGNAGDPTAIDIKNRMDRNDWTIKNSSEVESFYKSMGIRVGINVRF